MTQNSETSLLIPALGKVYCGLEKFSLPLLRIITGLLLMPHGAQKLFGWFGGGGLDGTASFLGNMGYPMPYIFALLIACVEFFGGLFLAIGFLTRPAAFAIAIFLSNAVSFHMSNGFFWTKGGYEYPLLWAVAAIVFLIRGGGYLSVDRAIGKEF